MKKQIIYLTGFMCSGKSTVGSILANTLGWDFFDLDELIVKKEGKSVIDIFSERGEAYFREVESETLLNVSSKQNLIIALGGGTIVSEKNRDIMKDTGILIYLDTSPTVIYQRLKHKTDRPLFRKPDDSPLSKKEALTKISTMLEERDPYYSEADLAFQCDGLSVGEIVDRLAQIIEKKYLKS